MIFAKLGMEKLPNSCNECKMGKRYGCVGEVKCRILGEYFTGNVEPPYKERPDECPLREFAEEGSCGDRWRSGILHEAVRTWGQDAQTLMMVEEMSELTKAICKLYRATDDGSASAAVENIREEMADVQIMLDQMKIMFGNVGVYERAKLDRLEKRLEAAHTKEGVEK